MHYVVYNLLMHYCKYSLTVFTDCSVFEVTNLRVTDDCVVFFTSFIPWMAECGVRIVGRFLSVRANSILGLWNMWNGLAVKHFHQWLHFGRVSFLALQALHFQYVVCLNPYKVHCDLITKLTCKISNQDQYRIRTLPQNMLTLSHLCFKEKPYILDWVDH